MKIVPSSCTKDDDIGIESMSITYIQNPDSESGSDDPQLLTVKAVMVPFKTYEDGDEIPAYINIETSNGDGSGHWSIMNSQNLKEIVDDFIKRLSIITNTNE